MFLRNDMVHFINPMALSILLQRAFAYLADRTVLGKQHLSRFAIATTSLFVVSLAVMGVDLVSAAGDVLALTFQSAAIGLTAATSTLQGCLALIAFTVLGNAFFERCLTLRRFTPLRLIRFLILFVSGFSTCNRVTATDRAPLLLKSCKRVRAIKPLALFIHTDFIANHTTKKPNHS